MTSLQMSFEIYCVFTRDHRPTWLTHCLVFLKVLGLPNLSLKKLNLADWMSSLTHFYLLTNKSINFIIIFIILCSYYLVKKRFADESNDENYSSTKLTLPSRATLKSINLSSILFIFISFIVKLGCTYMCNIRYWH